MKNLQYLIALVCFFLLSIHTTDAQNLSAGAQNAVNRLEKEYFPSLGKIKSEIESQRSTIASAKCNEYIEQTNRAVGVWNSIPKSELRNPKLSPTKKQLDDYIAFAKEAQNIYKERQTAERSNSSSQNNNNNKGQAVNTNFKVGDKVSVVASSEWTWGVVTGIAGKDFQPRAGIVGEDLEVDIQMKISYMPAGKQRVGLNNVFTYWNYHDFFGEIAKMRNKELGEFFKMIYEVVGKNAAPNYGVFTPNGKNLVQLQKEAKIIEELLKRYPALPEDAQKYADRSAVDVNVLAYQKALEGKNDFLKKKVDERIKEHLRLINDNDFSPESIMVGSQVKYVDDPKKTVFWSDLLCGNPENMKKALVKDINDFLSEMDMPANGDSYLANWSEMAAGKKSKFEKKANEATNWAAQYPFSDAQAPTLVKRDLGGNPSKIIFKTNAPKIDSDKSKRKYGIAFYPKKDNCPYFPYIEFYILETYRGPGKYDAPRCVFGASGYSKTM